MRLTGVCWLLVVSTSLTALADEYPKVVRRDGQVCVQTLDASGAVTESCRAETQENYAPPTPVAPLVTPPPGAPLSPPPAPAPAYTPAPRPQERQARLLDDPKAPARVASELALGQVSAFIPSVVGTLACNSLASMCLAESLVGGLVSFAVSSLVSGLLHAAFDGQAGVGWAFLGNLVGGAVALIFSLIAAVTLSPALLVMAGLVTIVLPSTAATIALELRHHALRTDPEAEARRPAQPSGLVAARF